ncbi:hypothetical protein Tco_1191559 [Tanacetum coccineum]
MSTSKTYQQSLADAGSENRPPMLERGSYIPWASRFRRYLNRKRDNRKWLLKALDEGPYEFKNFVPEGSTIPRLQTAEDLEGDDLLLHDAEMEVMNMILLSIPNEIYNSVDACTSAKDMWKRVERLMRGTIQNKVDRETRFTNEFDQFVAEPGEALVSVYNRFAQLMNDLERNNMNFPTVTINTKFLNSLQPEWLKYVTQVRLAKQLTVDSFDDLFDYLQQFEKLVNAKHLYTSWVQQQVILFSIHNDEWKSFQCHHQAALRRPYALSWKPCQGDSLNLPDHRIHKDGDGDASFQLKSDSLPHAHAQTTKTFYKHQDSRIMKAQELKTKTSAQTLIYKIFLQRYQVYQGRLLASFQDDAKYEHVGQDTRSQGGKDDQDGRIKI